MSRARVWPVIVVSLAVSIVGFVGCHSQKSAPPTASIKNQAKPASTEGNSKLIANWPTPAGAIIISGQQNGYLEPCGCTEGQLGGMARRADLIDRLQAQSWPLCAVDLGSVADARGARGGPEQSKIKFAVALRALGAMHYDALALSADDLKLGIIETLGQYNNLTDQPKVVAANVTPSQGFEAAVRPSVRSTAGPIKIGITAALDPETFKKLEDPDRDLLTVTDPAQALAGVLADLEKDTHTQVLLVQGPVEKARALAKALPGFDIVVATSEIDEPDAEPVMLNDGKTMLVQVGLKGKFVGVVGLFQDANQKYRFQRVNLNGNYKMADTVRKMIDEDLQNELKAANVVPEYVKRAYVGGAPGATFVGAATCKGCHPNTYARWASTKHSQAFKSIVEDKRGDRQFDAECVSCHTTGFEFASGYKSAELTPHLKGNQCENCHGPGSRHAAEPDNAEFRKLMGQASANPQKQLCYSCHDLDNSHNFEFTKYYSQIVHKGMDKYDDPKVHEGVKDLPASQ